MANTEFFDATGLAALDDTHKIGVGKGSSTAMNTITYAVLKTLISAINWVFTQNITVPNGTATGHAVNLGQLNGKQDVKSYATFDDSDESLEVKGTTRQNTLGATLGFLFIADTYTPTGAADANGTGGSITWDDDNVYIKTSHGWAKSALTLLP